MKKNLWLLYAYGKKYFIWVIYLLFAFFSIRIIIDSPQLGSKIFYSLVLIIALGIVLYYEYLKNLYSSMIQALTEDCDIPKALKKRDELQKQDFFKGFKQSIILFDLLLLLDSGEYQNCLAHIQKYQKFFSGTLDYLAIQYYTQMKCYAFLKESKMAEDIIKKLKHLKYVNNKNSKLSGLFSWEEIDAFLYALQGRNQKSLACLEQTPLDRMNHREQTYIYYERSFILQQLNRPQEVALAKKEAKRLGNTLFIVQ